MFSATLSLGERKANRSRGLERMRIPAMIHLRFFRVSIWIDRPGSQFRWRLEYDPSNYNGPRFMKQYGVATTYRQCASNQLVQLG